ncbi:hypothetical protein [Vulcaniibacterium gelatinicum]|uniref:hypothetical protein n=1 Tax=Vulcaniibacterium gelatinicum TaxID=2598725 RepID=UPI0011CAA3A0|nr:hypothetical protein [Vulcaniibacterium gelatinicum]
MATRYYLRLRDPARARAGGQFPFTAHGAEEFAAQLQQALRSDALFERWRQAQEDPDAVDRSLAATDPDATVSGSQHDLHIDLVATTRLPGRVFQHRMRLLAGSAWELVDVTAA